jgi:hypothetical protein
MAKRLEIDVNFLLALSSFESGWLEAHAQELHNLFGATHGGGPNFVYKICQEAADAWTARFGDGVKGVKTMDEFITALRKMGYNTKTRYYDDRLRNQYNSLLRRRDRYAK